MKITSPAFENNGLIPKKYSAYGENINPPLDISDIPEEAESLVLIMDDPDAPADEGVKTWDHWVVFNISPDVTTIDENWDVSGVMGQGTKGEMQYTGPKPPDKEHRYFFQVYALDTELALPPGATKGEVLEAMSGHIIEQAELIGRFEPES